MAFFKITASKFVEIFAWIEIRVHVTGYQSSYKQKKKLNKIKQYSNEVKATNFPLKFFHR